MVNLELSKEEARALENVLDRYLMHLEVEIVKTEKKEFKEALKERKKILVTIGERLKEKIKLD
ncbi:MAG TPA: hypothetical protein PLM71_06140 [Syntrophorhabdaceae bacterium]|nr:hypothetical protein [Syntrophorhabdaceae bacterium]